MDRGKWKTKDGQILAIASMETEHLRRCIALLDRELERNHRLVTFSQTVRGELAREHAEEAIGEAMMIALGLELKRDELRAELRVRENTPRHNPKTR